MKEQFICIHYRDLIIHVRISICSCALCISPGHLIFKRCCYDFTFDELKFLQYQQFCINDVLYSSLHNRISKILRRNIGFVLKLTVLYFIGISSKSRTERGDEVRRRF
ncbi:hypothetical protein FHG68_21195 (plasmid) [Leptospira weilii]|nr:hypothetical protein FHG67_21410 [Leptospira weilii]QDK29157.1 hypothetical protein FHG68_21195 [Leptospira weilii]